MKLLSQIIFALLVASGLLIVAFGPRGAGQVPPDRVVITYWEKWTGNEGRQMRQIVDWFNDTVGREKGIYVQFLSITQVDRKTLTATAAGVPPDVAGLWQRETVQFARRGALMPLDDLARPHGITQSTYKPVFWDMCTVDGRLYALISTPATMALHYYRRHPMESADAFRAAGLNPTGVPRSIAELDRWAELLDRRGPDGRITRGGYIPMEPGWYITVTPFWFGGRLWDPDRGTFYFTTPETLAAFEWVQSYPLRLGKDALSDFSSASGGFGTPTSPFIAGTVSMVLQGPWMANFTFTLRPAMSEWVVPKSVEMLLPRVARSFNYEWAAEAFPSVDPERLTDVTFADCDTLVIPKGAKHPREAFEFIAFVQRQDVIERLNSMHCKPTPLTSVSDDFIRRHPNPYIAVFERLARSPNAHGQVKSPIQQEIGGEIELAIQEIYLLKRTPAEALAALQKRAESKFAAFMARQQLRDIPGAPPGGTPPAPLETVGGTR